MQLLKKAKENVEAVLKDKDASEKQIKSALNELESAYQKLQEKDITSDEKEESDKALPRSVTPMFNLLLIGMTLIVAGSILAF